MSTREPKADERGSYVVRCRSCGRLTGAVVDDPAGQGFTAQTTARWIRDGRGPVEALSMQGVRAAGWCHCERPEQKQAVSAAAGQETLDL
jgi:hypothetical protein